METFKIILFALSGLLLVFVGITRISNPIKAYAKSPGINLDNDVNLLNEMRGLGAVMFSAGVLVLLGTILPEFNLISYVIGTLIFIGFAIGRFISIGTDGKPNKQVVQGIVFELIFGAGHLFGVYSSLS